MTRSSAKSCTTAALWTTTMSVKNVRKWGDVSSGRTGRNASSSKLQQKKNGIHIRGCRSYMFSNFEAIKIKFYQQNRQSFVFG